MSAPSTEIRLIDSPELLGPLALRLAEAPRLGVDTEFHAEHRYEPELLLLQIAEPDGPVWLIDPRTCDLRPLGAALSTVPLVVHGGEQDVALLTRATGQPPTAVFDTQVAAGMVGLGFPARLGDLCEEVLGLELDKEAGLSDWTRRPLSARQVRYAAADATVLVLLAEALEALLAERGRASWAWEASGEAAGLVAAAGITSQEWLRWEVAWRMREEERAALHALHLWRDEVGRERNQAPRSVLSDGLALDIARRSPRSMDALSDNRRMPPSLVRRHGNAILDVLRAVSTDRGPTPPPTEAAVVERGLQAWAGVLERKTGIARSLALPPALSWHVAEQGPEVVTGWRREAFGDALDKLWSGQAALVLNDGQLNWKNLDEVG